MNHPARGRRKRTRQLILACSIVALVAVLVIVLETVNTRETPRMAPPRGYTAGQLVFDDQFPGTSLNSAHWSAAMSGQGDSAWNTDGLPAGDSAAGTQS